jgi:hypothetical protein
VPAYKIDIPSHLWLQVGDALVPGNPVFGLHRILKALAVNGESIEQLDGTLKKFGRGRLEQERGANGAAPKLFAMSEIRGR